VIESTGSAGGTLAQAVDVKAAATANGKDLMFISLPLPLGGAA
jgi:hypothetical protein